MSHPDTEKLIKATSAARELGDAFAQSEMPWKIQHHPSKSDQDLIRSSYLFEGSAGVKVDVTLTLTSLEVKLSAGESTITFGYSPEHGFTVTDSAIRIGPLREEMSGIVAAELRRDFSTTASQLAADIAKLTTTDNA